MKHMHQIDTMIKRVEFASSRIHMIQGIVARRNTQQQKKIKDLELQSQKPEHIAPIKPTKNNDLTSHYEREILKLKHERDFLLKKTQEDTTHVDSRVSQVIGNCS